MKSATGNAVIKKKDRKEWLPRAWHGDTNRVPGTTWKLSSDMDKALANARAGAVG